MVTPADSLAAAGPQVAEAKAQFSSLQAWEPLLGAWERICAGDPNRAERHGAQRLPPRSAVVVVRLGRPHACGFHFRCRS